jgi:hypothetical protein
MSNKQLVQMGKVIKDIQADLDLDKKKKLKDKNSQREKRAFMKLPEFTPRMGFWCDHCQLDFTGPAFKFWSEVHQIGTWQSFCPNCESWVYRHITSKVIDPDYFKSECMSAMRGIHEKDLLQPGDYGFNTIYNDPFESYYYQFQHRQEELHNKYAAMGLVGKTLAEQEDEEDFDMEDMED